MIPKYPRRIDLGAKGLGDSDNAKDEQLVRQLKEKMAVYDQILHNPPYLAGSEITSADLFHLPLGVWVEKWYPEVLVLSRM